MKKLLTVVFVIVLIILAAIPSIYFYNKYQTLQKQFNATNPADDLSKLLSLVGRHILLPSGETPTVLSVTDKEKLSGQQFFANAKNGDKVLIYQKAKKAFLYDPDADKIIEVGPIVTATASGAITPVITPTISPTIQIQVTPTVNPTPTP